MANVTVALGTAGGGRFDRALACETDTAGEFTFDLRDIATERTSTHRELRVFDADDDELQAHGDVRWRRDVDPGPLVICATPANTCLEPSDSPPNGYPPVDGVWGRIRHKDGTALEQVMVELWDSTKSGEVPVGSMMPLDPGGWYKIPGVVSGAVIVKVKHPGTGALLSISRAYFAPVFPLRIDLDVCDDEFRRRTEWARVEGDALAALAPTPPNAATIRELAWISGSTGWAFERVAMWSLAHRLSAAMGADPEALYGLLRMGFPKTVQGLSAKPPGTVQPALNRAADRNIVARAIAESPALDALLAALLASRKTELNSGRDTALGAILSTSGGLTATQVSDFVDAWVDHVGPEADFWAQLPITKPSFANPADVDEAKRLLTLGAIGLSYAPIVSSTLTTIGGAPASAVAALTAADWTTIASAGRVPTLPDGLPGSTDSERRANLATLLAEHAERFFPAATARAALVAAVGAGHPLEPAKDFLTANPSFDLATSRADDATFTGTAAEKAAANRAQRLYRTAPGVRRAQAITTLAEQGFDSAHGIAMQTHARFQALQEQRNAASESHLDVETATVVARNAQWLQSMSATLYMAGHNQEEGDFAWGPDANGSVDTSTDPGWATIYAAAPNCACTQCMSVHGPAAYLFDLLYWLEVRPTTLPGSTGSLLDKLGARRPDLLHVELTCKNAETALPYIDFTIEALESAVADSGSVGVDAGWQTEGDTNDLLSRPEHRIDAAYATSGADAKLDEETSAVILPYLRPLEEGRAFLRHLQADRTALLDAYSALSSVSDDDIAEEQLGMFTARLATITTGTGGTEADYWPVATSALTDAPTFVRVSGLAWSEVLDLLHSRYANPRTWSGAAWEPSLSVASIDPCDIDTFTIVQTAGGSAPTDNQWTRVRQFLRLARDSGLTFRQLDAVLQAIDNSFSGEWLDNKANWLVPLGTLHALAEQTGIEPTLLAMTCAAELDTDLDRAGRTPERAALYDQIFLAKDVLGDDDGSRAKLALNAQRSEIVTGSTIAEVEDVLSSALGIDRDALQFLIDQRLPANPPLTLANVTELYAWTVIGRAIGLSSGDAVRLADAAGLTPRAVGAGLVDTAALRAMNLQLSSAGWSVDEFLYVLNHEAADEVGPTNAFVQQALGRVRDAAQLAVSVTAEDSTEAGARDAVIAALASELGLPADALASVRAEAWTQLPTLAGGTAFTTFEASELDVGGESVTAPQGTEVILSSGTSLLEGGAATTLAADRPAAIDAETVGTAVRIALQAGTTWTMSGAQSELGAGTAATAVTITLPIGTTLTALDDRADLELTSATNVRVALPSFGLETSAAHVGTLEFPSAPSSPDIALRFRRDAFVQSSGSADNPYDDLVETGSFADDYEWFRALHKAAIVLAKLGLERDDRHWWLTESRSGLWSIAGAWGLSGTGAAAFSFDDLSSLVELFALRDQLPTGEPPLADLLDLGAAIPSGGAPEVTAFAAALSTRTGWPAPDIEVAAGQVGASPATVAGLSTLMARMQLGARTAVDPETLQSWAVAAADVTAAMSAEIVEAARARHGTESSWQQAARPVRDQLRKGQRDALVAWLMANPPTGVIFDTPDDLYEYYLIDVSMNPEMLTSRIVQASATVQLFVHRLMLGLEREDDGSGTLAMLFEPNNEDRAQWEWMRTYRVWEAARKVFLYPENWIEPELRDDKTPFFVSMEQELAQGDVTLDRVEEVTRGYLTRLAEVSSLEVLAYHHQTEALAADGGDDIDLLHVVARTRSQPPTYWYRRLEEGERWTAWEPVECGVEGQHVLLTVVGRRPFLVWASLQEAADLATESTSLEARVYCSELQDSGWSPPRMSQAVPAGRSAEAVRLTWSPDPTLAGPRIRLEEDVYASLVAPEGGPLYPDGYESGPGAVGVLSELFLDPCSGIFTPVTPPTALQVRRDAGIGLGWRSSRYWLDVPGALSPYDPTAVPAGDELALWWQDATDDGAPVDGAPRLAVPLLASAGVAGLVVPSWPHDFVSQSPFFAQQPNRSWFVRVEQTGEVEIDEYVRGLTSLTEGTYLPEPPFNPTAEPADIAPLTVDYETVAATTIEAQVLQWDAAILGFNDGDQPAPPPVLYHFSIFYHPLCCVFTDAVRRGGVFALLDPSPSGPETRLAVGSLRRQAAVGTFDFGSDLSANPLHVEWSRTTEDIDFSEDGAFAQYNWELFFHLPFYVATRLMNAGRHDDALRFLHTMFDPRVGDDDVDTASPWTGPARWWKVAPLMEPVAKPVMDWLGFVGGDSDALDQFAQQVDAWRCDPFNPHLLARLRPGTYQKAVVMRYLENLIGWGDALFARDSLETINEATQLYVFALQILGTRPQTPERGIAPTPKTYASIAAEGDVERFRNIAFENAYIGDVAKGGGGDATAVLNGSVAYPYFCIPRNATLLSYWDTLEDRLFKIRNGMNIDGVVRTLPLFQPPIDPAMLVRAAAAGLDIGSVVAGLAAPRPRHRFPALLARAQRLASAASGLGQSLLSALEKKDAEVLAQLRQDQELRMLELNVDVRAAQVDEAKQALRAMRTSRSTVETRRAYYEQLVDEGWLAEENDALALSQLADGAQLLSGVYSTMGSFAGAFPDVSAGVAAAVTTGGAQASRVMGVYSSAYATVASGARGQAAFLTTTAAYQRRAADWQLQLDLATSELEQLDQQIVAAEIRVDIADREWSNARQQIRHSKDIQAFYRRKFTNADLYSWMSSQLSTLHFQQYQLAVAASRQAERSLNYELGRNDTFVGTAHYDRGRKGLLAGERLTADLDRMEATHFEHRQRELELTKNVSLRRLDPLALVRLRSTGECFVDLAEAVYDLDCPGHHLRRLQHVSVTVACVSGSDGHVHARLTLHGTQVRRTADGELEREATSEYPSIMTSTGVDDAGLPVSGGGGDARYLPFEGRGAVSQWHLALANQAYPQFDWSSITDVVLHVRYTARDGGPSARAAALARLPATLDALRGGYVDSSGTIPSSGKAVVAISAKRDQPDAWFQAQQGLAAGFEFVVGSAYLPYFATGKVDAVPTVHVLWVGGSPTSPVAEITGPGGTPGAESATLTSWPSGGNSVWHGTTGGWTSVTAWPDTVDISALTDGAAVTVDALDDLIIILEFSVAP